MVDFKAKDLTYDKSQPAFLQRLRAEFGGVRNNVQFDRPGKSRLQIGGDVEEDGPTIVDDKGEGVSKEEYERMLKDSNLPTDTTATTATTGQKKEENSQAGRERSGDGDGDTRVSRQQKGPTTETGNVKKRKVAGKVVGSNALAEDDEGEGGKGEGDRITKKASGATQDAVKASTQASLPKKKKAKKIKLSFDDDAGGG